jgi:hypothetical protein
MRSTPARWLSQRRRCVDLLSDASRPRSAGDGSRGPWTLPRLSTWNGSRTGDRNRTTVPGLPAKPRLFIVSHPIVQPVFLVVTDPLRRVVELNSRSGQPTLEVAERTHAPGLHRGLGGRARRWPLHIANDADPRDALSVPNRRQTDVFVRSTTRSPAPSRRHQIPRVGA